MDSETQSQFSPQDTLLFDLVFQRIEKSPGDSISFADYVELVLYHPEKGYYARPHERVIGRGGDFFTSVSVGECFGFLLAQRLLREWRTVLDEDAPLVVVEQGAHDGRLARDVVDAIRELAPDRLDRFSYCIIEHRDSIRTWLSSELEKEGYGDVIEVFSDFDEAWSEQGVFLANELLDAFPFHRAVIENGEWRELAVGWEDGPAWVVRDLDGALAELLPDPSGFSEGYETEVCPFLRPWTRDASTLFRRGLWWVIDYGYLADDYFAPSRSKGTYRCYREHKASEKPFEALGETDITVHVNFSDLRRESESVGLSWRHYTDQHHFLIDSAREWLLSIEGAPPAGKHAQRLRQFQTLTHPGLMGQQFKVAELSRGID